MVNRRRRRLIKKENLRSWEELNVIFVSQEIKEVSKTETEGPKKQKPNILKHNSGLCGSVVRVVRFCSSSNETSRVRILAAHDRKMDDTSHVLVPKVQVLNHTGTLIAIQSRCSGFWLQLVFYKFLLLSRLALNLASNINVMKIPPSGPI